MDAATSKVQQKKDLENKMNVLKKEMQTKQHDATQLPSEIIRVHTCEGTQKKLNKMQTMQGILNDSSDSSRLLRSCKTWPSMSPQRGVSGHQ